MDLSKSTVESYSAYSHLDDVELNGISQSELRDKLVDARVKADFYKKLSQAQGKLLETRKKEIASMNREMFSMGQKIEELMMFQNSDRNSGLDALIEQAERNQRRYELEHSKCTSTSQNSVNDVPLKGNPYVQVTPRKHTHSNVVGYGKEKENIGFVNRGVVESPISMEEVKQIPHCGQTDRAYALESIGRCDTPFASPAQNVAHPTKRRKTLMFGPNVGHENLEGLTPLDLEDCRTKVIAVGSESKNSEDWRLSGGFLVDDVNTEVENASGDKTESDTPI